MDGPTLKAAMHDASVRCAASQNHWMYHPLSRFSDDVLHGALALVDQKRRQLEAELFARREYGPTDTPTVSPNPLPETR